MSLALERQLIESFFIANWTATPIGLDGGSFTPAYGMDGRPDTSVSLSIVDGDMMQQSIGRVANVYGTPAHIAFMIYHDGALGSSAWRGIADSLINLFFNVAFDTAGAIIATNTQTAFLRFCPPELGDNRFAQLGPLMTQAPFALKPVTIPFIRYETR